LTVLKKYGNTHGNTRPIPVAAVSAYDGASVLATVTSQTTGFPSFHGIMVNLPGRFSCCLFRPDGSLVAGIPAALKAAR